MTTDTAPLPPEIDSESENEKFLREKPRLFKRKDTSLISHARAIAIADELSRLRAEIAEKDREVERLRTPPKTLASAVLEDAQKAVAVLFTMLVKLQFREGAAVADEIGANIGAAFRDCARYESQLTAARAERDAAVALVREMAEWQADYFPSNVARLQRATGIAERARSMLRAIKKQERE